jgi:hypothetical protein
MGEGANWPGGAAGGEASLGFTSFVANLETQRLELSGLALEMLGLNVSGNLVGENVMDDLSLQGRIDIGEFDPRELMAAFNQSIETADPDVLNVASASAEFYFDSNRMGLRDMARPEPRDGTASVSSSISTSTGSTSTATSRRRRRPMPRRLPPTRARSTRSTCRSRCCGRSTRAAPSRSPRRNSSA